MKLVFRLVIFTLLLNSCAPSRFVKPLEKGEQAVNFSFGGPLIEFSGAVIPIPYTGLTYANGMGEKTTIFASLHTTALLFGNFQTDIGVLHELIKPDSVSFFKSGLSVKPVVNIIADKWERNFRLWPQLDVNTYQYFGKNKNHLVYVGLSNWFETNYNKAHGQRQEVKWLINPQAGVMLCKTLWSHQIELKYLVPNEPNNNKIVAYFNPLAEKGAFGLFYSITRKF
ncbi:MAG: hypothetical protein ACK4K0_09295 [Flavobacteriales bacterium]